MPGRVAILQSSYLPWKGYFDLIHDVDLFVFYDDVAYTHRDWRSRNRIKTPNGPGWLTVPVGPARGRLICDVELPAAGWASRHWRSLAASYCRAPYFQAYAPLLQRLLLDSKWSGLSELNQVLVRTIAAWLGIETTFVDSRRYRPEGRKLDRLLDLLRRLDASTYVSGPAAKAYIVEERFAEAGIALEWKDYAGYPEYPQLYPPFLHQVTVLDLLFHVGPAAPDFIWGWRSAAAFPGRSPAVSR